MNILERLVDKYENAYRAAKVIGVSPQLFHNWQDQGYIPFKRGEQVEKATGGFIKASEVYIEAAKGGK